jgi:hypothetical protein
MRVRTMMRDSASTSRRVTDGRRPDDWKSLHRPGFRILNDGDLDTTLDAVAKTDAYRSHEEYLNNAWRNPAPVVRKPTTDTFTADDKVCPDCDGTGFDEGDAPCPTCGGEGTVDDDDYGDAAARHADHRTVTLDQMRANHARNMARIYDQIECDLQNRWRDDKSRHGTAEEKD